MAGLIVELTEAGGESRLGISWLERIAGIWNPTRLGSITYRRLGSITYRLYLKFPSVWMLIFIMKIPSNLPPSLNNKVKYINLLILKFLNFIPFKK